MKYIKQITYVLILVGALNWGIYGVSGFNLVANIFGSVPVVARVLYVLVGLSAVYVLLVERCMCFCKQCSSCKVENCSECPICTKPEEDKK